MENMENNPKNWFVRILIILFCLGIASMIFFNFFCVEPYGEFKNGIFFLLSILLILVLAESFDNFSIGQIVSIKREIKNKEKENKKLEQRNTELISHIISITNPQTQKQQSTNIFREYYSDKPNVLQPVNNDTVQELIDRIGNSVVIADIENNIKKELVEKGFDITGETTKVLLRHLAGSQLLLTFEKINIAIFGSQIRLLRLLNSSDGISEEDVSQYYSKVRLQFSEILNSWELGDYLSFLYSSMLIIKQDNNIYITNLGVEYLVWITKNRIKEDKPL